MTEATHFRYSAGDEPIAGYVLVERLGQGASGSVWKAQGPGKTIALKIVDLKQKIGQKELRALKRVKDINHPNLVPIFAFWLKDSSGRTIDDDQLLDQLSGETTGSSPKAIQLIIAMGLGESTLGDHLRACRKRGESGIPREELLDYIDSAAKAIDYLNQQYGIQHGDVKPTNILLVGGGIQVCDFGLACAVRDDIRQTTAGYSPAYAAPELIAEDASTGRSDQYALAVTFVELLTGRLPFPIDPEDLYNAKTRGQITVDGLGDTDRQTVLRATALNPSERYETCVEMIKSLRTNGSSSSDGLTGYRPEYEAGDIPVPGYKLVQELGIGGAGQVWRATRAGVEVALKIVNLDRNIGQKELEALRLVKEFKHPNLIPIHGFWLKDDHGTLRDGSQVDLAAPTTASSIQETTGSAAMDRTVDLSTPPADGTVDLSAPPAGDFAATPDDGTPDDGTVDVSGGKADPLRTTPIGDDGPMKAGDSGVIVPRSTQLIIAMGLGDATLADRLTECDEQEMQGIPRKEVLDYLHDAAEAIDLLNEKGIQHCDIKPTNILMVGRGEDVKGGVQVCDFGLAQAVSGDRSKASPAYSPPYAAPELMKGEGPTATTDQFSLAVTYVELRTNEIPYPCKSLKKLKAAKLAGQIDLSNLPRRDRRVIRRACSLDPSKRYRNTRQMVAALQRRSMAVPIVIELMMIIALTAFFFYPRPNDDRQTLQKIATHLEATDYPMAWDRTGDLEDEDDRNKSRREVVDAWQNAILASSSGRLEQQADLIHNKCNLLLGRESDHPRAALAGPQIFVLRARAKARLDQWDAALLDLDRAAQSLDQLESSDPTMTHHHLLTVIHQCIVSPDPDARAIGDDESLISRIEAIAEARSTSSESWEPWDHGNFDQVIEAIIAFAEQLDESTSAFANLSNLIRRVTGNPADREILLERVSRLATIGGPDEIQRCETILAGLAERYDGDESRQMIEKYRCVVRLVDPATPWTSALDAFEKLDAASSSEDDASWLLSAMTQRLYRHALESPQAIEYPTLQRHCLLYRARNPNDVTTNACWLESTIELQLSGGQGLPENTHSILQSLFEQLSRLPPEQQEYCRYVRSLILFHGRDSQQIGTDLVLVAQDDSDSWLTPHRRQRMADMLLALSSSLIGEVHSGPADASDVYLNQPDAAIAEQAGQFSATAYRLDKSGPQDETFRQLIRIRALSAYYDGMSRGDSNWHAEVIGLLDEYEQLHDSLDGKLHLIRALSHAQVEGEVAAQQSIRSFAAVLRAWFKSIDAPMSSDEGNTPGRRRYDANKPSVMVCRQVIEPALAVAKLRTIGETQPGRTPLPEVPSTMTVVADELAAILAMKGYLLLTDHDVRRFYATKVQPEQSGTAAREAYNAYRWANEIDAGNEEYLFGLGLAFHALPNVRHSDKLGGLNWVVRQADQHGLDSPKVRGLRGFVKALKARNAILLVEKAEYYDAARSDFLQALRQARELSDQDRLFVEPSYLVSLSSVDLELAFVREKRERRRSQARKLLNEAIQMADRATNTNWASAPELPWISRGNAQEDMALYVRDGEQHYAESITSFSTARDIAFSHWRSTKLATLSRERCRFRFVSSKDPDEPTIRKIARDLSRAHKGKDPLDWEIMFWIGEAYRLLAERQNDPQDVQRARQAYQLASENAKGNSNDWPVYNIGWAEFEVSQEDDQRAAELAKEVLQLGVDKVRDDIFLRAIPIAYQGRPAEEVATQIEPFLAKVQRRPFMQAELRLIRAPLWVQAARDNPTQARRLLRRAYQDCRAVLDWSQNDLTRRSESEKHFRARAVAWIGGVTSNYDYLELLADENRQATINRLKPDLDRAIRDLTQEDRPSSADALKTAAGVWKYFFDETHPAL